MANVLPTKKPVEHGGALYGCIEHTVRLDGIIYETRGDGIMNNIQEMKDLVDDYVETLRNQGESDRVIIGYLMTQLSWSICKDPMYKKVVIEGIREQINETV